MGKTQKLKIVFMGTPDFALTALKAIVEKTDHDVVCVYSQPPRPKGRGHKVQLTPVHEYAQSQGIEVRTPKSLKNKQVQEDFIALKADIAIVAAYGLILPKAILEAPQYGCINIHASLLPRWRGASPIQQAIWKGDQETGVTLMQMDKGLDTGAMISKSHTPITAETTASNLHDILAQQGGALIVALLEQITTGTAPTPEPQDDALATYAPLLTKEDSLIDWNRSAEAIDRQIRALNPWPGVKNNQFKFLTTKVMLDTTDQPVGTILDRKGHIACGEGTVLQILHIQPAGKKPMDFAAAINGGYLKVGDILA